MTNNIDKVIQLEGRNLDPDDKEFIEQMSMKLKEGTPGIQLSERVAGKPYIFSSAARVADTVRP